MPVALVVSAGQPECHFYFARRVSFLSCADTHCEGCHERSEGRLAEMDPSRKNRRRLYRARNDRPSPGAAPSRRRVISANVSPVIAHGGEGYHYSRYRTASEAC